ncbi:permease [Bifidobacterium cuniculi]|uniref:Permease n=2 Tax=Bifidobacterium cuniculi TaxID=1688 RepID=A0A087AWQ9_9BIFI|nr:permease [Bifidobacterium cuniculi]
MNPATDTTQTQTTPTTSKSTMSTFALWRLFHRSDTRTRSTNTNPTDSTTLLAVIAFAAATAIFLTVLGGLHGFIWRASPDHTVRCLVDPDHCLTQSTPFFTGDMEDTASLYVILALFACLLLLVPFVALAGSAARLAASRRDERLATLRLVGATTAQVTRLTAFDAMLQSVTGALIGVAGYFAIMPLIMLLNFQDAHFTFEQLWVGPWALIGTVVGVAVLSLVSALLTLRRVAITPLGVTARASQPMPGKWRAIIFMAGVLIAFTVLKNLGQLVQSQVVAIAVVIVFIVGCFALVNLVGCFAVSARARALARHPKDAATMLAARRILDNPKRAWRNVSGIALAVFIAGITSICGYVGTTDSNGDQVMATVMRDIGTGGMLTLVFAAVLAAVSSGVMQSASVIDQAPEYRMLVLEGTDERTLARARYREVLSPLNTVVVLTMACSVFLMIPLLASAMTEPATMLTFVAGVALCYALVLVGALAANRTAARLNRRRVRADD